jgi:ABC-type polysaccharide/polyol phosphate transport system ATPase subunit
MPQASLPPVVVDRVHKRFELPREKVHTLKERALHPLRRSPVDVLHALNGISFAVSPGEFFGIVGRNGSGKSTLLKCLAGIYAVDTGAIYINGRMSTFIELGVGFNPDLPARDNVMLNATMLGLSPREGRRRFDSVIDFAELREFVDLKLKNYSTGMMVRLAFSVMIQVDAEILLIDEVLAVGDAAFQQKCFDEFERIRASGSTVLFVTHDMGAVRRFCDRAMLLERGHMVEMGDPEQIGNHYLELNFSHAAREAEKTAAAAAEREEAEAAEAAAHGHGGADAQLAAEDAARGAFGEGGDTGAGADPSAATVAAEASGTAQPGSANEAGPDAGEAGRFSDGAAEIVDAWFENDRGERTGTLSWGKPCTFVAQVHFNEDVEHPLFGLSMQNSHRDPMVSASNLHTEPRLGMFRAGEQTTFRVAFDNHLAPDRYRVTPSVTRHGGAWMDNRDGMLSVVVTGTRATGALVELPYQFTVTHEQSPPVAVRAESTT